MIRYVFLSLIALLSFGKVHSQVITTRPGADTMKVVTLINADRLSYKHPNDTTDLQMLAGNVQLKQENTIINCDSAVFNKRTRFVEAFGNVHIIDKAFLVISVNQAVLLMGLFYLFPQTAIY